MTELSFYLSISCSLKLLRLYLLGVTRTKKANKSSCPCSTIRNKKSANGQLNPSGQYVSVGYTETTGHWLSQLTDTMCLVDCDVEASRRDGSSPGNAMTSVTAFSIFGLKIGVLRSI